MTDLKNVAVWIGTNGDAYSEFLLHALPDWIAGRRVEFHGRPACVMESSRFVDMEQAGLLRPYIAQLLDHLNALRNAFLPRYQNQYILLDVARTYTDGRRSAQRTFRLSVLPKDAFESAFQKDGIGEYKVARLLRLADRDDRVAHALRLVRDEDIGWAPVYDVIEFLTAEGAVNPKSPDVARHRRTATYYRHPGNPDPSQLPDHPPLVEESRVFVLERLLAWLESKL